MEYARTLEFSSDERTLVLEVAFEHGLVEIDVREVLAIELRDRLLKLAELEAPDEARESGPDRNARSGAASLLRGLRNKGLPVIGTCPPTRERETDEW